MKRIMLPLVVGLATSPCAEPAADVRAFERKVREKKPYASTGIIVGKDIVVFSPEVKEPRHLRHLYRSPYKSNLFNEAGLPLGPLHLDVK